ncbi:MAG TPA: SLC13 family permease [Thermoanaerobaculia bacterium]|nr:SLC13 family permease [Thermoanaerobaculia bacterium]
MDPYILVGIIVFMLVSFALQWLPLDVTALTTLALLLLFDLVTPQEAIAGFSNEAVITVMMMFILSHALVESGLIHRLGYRVTHISGRSPWRATTALLVTVGVLSAFINNTAAVAIFMPLALMLAKHYKISPSKLLIPLSYVSIAGGTCTLIGTSTNLLVSSLAVDAGMEPFQVFEFFAFGGVLFVVVLAYNLFVNIRTLPPRADAADLTGKYSMGAYLTELRVPEGSPLVGSTVLDEGISERFGLNVLEIIRGKVKISQDIRNTPLAPEDLLLVRGSMEDIVALRGHFGLQLLTDLKLADASLTDRTNVLAEMQVTPQSQLAGQTLKDIDFRKRYGAFVLALNRTGALIRDKVAFIPLQPWDILLVFGPRARIEGLGQQEDFLPVGELDVKIRLAPRWWLPLIVIPIVVFTASLAFTSILKAAILGAVALLLGRSLTIQQAYKSINWTVIFLLAAVLPLGVAMQKTGLAATLGGAIASLGDHGGPLLVLGVIVVVTALMTEVVSNNSAAVLMVPIALSAAATLGVDAKPMVMAVTFAASMSFMTPVGYQTNTMVYGPGAYRFTDYLRAGAPLALAGWIMAVLLIPRIWPF